MESSKSKPINRESIEKNSNRRRLGRPNTYPWDRWFNSKKSLTLKRGEDYFCQDYAMMGAFRKQAGRRGVIVHVSVNVGFIKVTIERKPNA